LGVTLYELVCGVTPFDAEQIHELVAKVCFGKPTPVSTHRADVPPGLEAVLMTCLENDPGRRFANVAQLAAALAPFAPTRPESYAESVASALGLEVAPARPTDLLPGDPLARSAAAAPLARSAGATQRAQVAGTTRAVVALAPVTPASGPRAL